MIKILRPYLKANPQNEYITRAEAAKILRISLPTLRSWTLSGRLKSYRVGSRVRYKKTEVESAVREIPSLK